MKACKHCNKQVTLPHYCPKAGKTIREEDEGDFLLSAVLGAVTDNAIIGGLLGGSLAGGIIGDIMGDGDLF